MNEREHSDGVGETCVEDNKNEGNSRKEQAGQEIPEHPIGAENAGDSVGNTTGPRGYAIDGPILVS